MSTPNIVLWWYFDSLVAMSGGGYADPRWTTTLTAFDSKDEVRELIALRLSSLFNTYPHGRFTCRSERPSDDNARPHPCLSAHKLLVPRILLTASNNTFSFFTNNIEKPAYSSTNLQSRVYPSTTPLSPVCKNGQRHAAFQVWKSMLPILGRQRRRLMKLPNKIPSQPSP